MPEVKSKFQKLTPMRDVEIGIYSEALDYVLYNDELQNIAVSGAYSAGKSSVLETYKVQHSEKRFIHISLAHFEEAGVSSDLQEAQENETKQEIIRESILEGKILNQLIHQIPPSRIPQTNFRTKQKVEPKRVVLWTALAVAFTLSILHVVFFGSWQTYVESISTVWLKVILRLTTRNSSVLLTGAICVVLLGILLYHVIKAQINKNIFKKISADRFEIEIFEGSDDSYFDKYLNEVLYLFDQCEADVIVFEDMDRYNTNRIFERLREINNLINIQRRNHGGGSKPLRFFYLLRDDIFISKDRTKFFDFIIPIIPVIDSSNSYDQFIKYLTDSELFNLFDESFLQGVSLYIDDMRILKNICNEFLIYNSHLNKIELTHNKLMAMVVYKNLFPRDFSDLQLGRGFVFTLFDKREQFVASRIVQLERDIAEAKGRIEAVKKEHLMSAEELELVNKYNKEKIEDSTRNYNYDELARQKRKGLLQVWDAEYTNRKQAISDREKNQIPVLESIISGLQSEIVMVKNETLRGTITNNNISEIFSLISENEIGVISDFNEIRGNAYFPLLKYLIRNGYIDESYADYMTYFYENSLSRTDKIFLRSISDHIMKAPEYQLKEPHKVVSRLATAAFGQPEILNYDLLFYLLRVCAISKHVPSIYHQVEVPTFPAISTSNAKEAKLLLAMVEQILNETDYGFLQCVFLSIRDERLNYLVNLLNSVRVDCLEKIVNNQMEFASSFRDEFVFRTLIVTPDDLLMKNKSMKESLALFISNQADFLNANRLYEDLLKSMFGSSAQSKLIREMLFIRFEEFGIRFQAIKHIAADAKLFEQVYQHSLYILNFGNIALMLKTKYGLKVSEDFKHKNYTLIKTQPDTPLAVYVEEEIDDYIATIIANCGGKIRDNEADVIAILNNEAISIEHKLNYIDVLTTSIESIADVSDSKLWKKLLTSELVAHTERNVLDYYCANDNALTDDLIEFLNNCNNGYNYSMIRFKYEDALQSKFFNSVLRCNKLNNQHYKAILKTLKRSYYNGFSVQDISDEKILILIGIGAIPMRKDSLVFMREHYPDAIMAYIKKFIYEYVNAILDEDNFDLKEALGVLQLSLADKYKLCLLEKIKEPLTARREEYSDAVKSHILTNNLYREDIAHFIVSYPSEGELTKVTIENIVLDNMQAIFDEECIINKCLADKLLTSDILQETKLMIFALLLPTLDEVQCKNYLHQLGLQDYLGLFEQRRPKIEITPINTRLLEGFRRKDWITKFEKDKREGWSYRAFGRKTISVK